MKTHHYIISFDPRDAADNGLTMETAQALGLKFCEENFPGHPAIVCTHPDGHNHSGNIHVHIVIGNVRTREVERKPYMQKPRDWLEGMKHSSTAQTMRHLRVEVMELCESAGLYQIDLLNGSKERVNEAEYWARRRGQMKLDRENAALTATGQQPRQKKFETVKDILRRQISDVLDTAMSFEDFSDRLLQQYGITVKESRGRLSYLPAGRTKFIRAHSIGDKFEKGLVLATLQKNAERKRAVQPKPDHIGKLVNIQAKLARSQLKAIYKDNADTIVGNMDSQIFLGGSEPTTLKDLSEMLGKETIDAFNTSDTRGNSPSYGTTFQKMGHELLSRDELAVLDGGKCILQLRGVRPFLSDKYDLTQHPNYKLTSDYDPKNTFDIEEYLNRKEKIHPDDEFIVVDADSLPPA